MSGRKLTAVERISSRRRCTISATSRSKNRTPSSPPSVRFKLPCLKRTEGGELGVRFLDLDVAEIVRLRRELILSTAVSFRPDIVLVDKKPDGLAGELEPSLRYIRCNLPQTRI